MNSAARSEGVDNHTVPCDEQSRGHGRHVLFVTSSFPRWKGDSTTPFILNLAQDLQELDWKVHVIAPHAPGAAPRESLDGISVERFRYLWPDSAQTVCYQGGALVNLRHRPSGFVKLPALVGCELFKAGHRLAGGKFSLVHSHWLLPQGLTAGIAARVLGVPHVSTVHGGDVFALRSPLWRPFKRAALRLSDVVTVNSSATELAVRQIDGNCRSIQRIPIGAAVPAASDAVRVETIRRRWRVGVGPMLVFVGRLIEEKGVRDLLDAIAGLRKVLPDVTCLIVGDGPDRDAFAAKARLLSVDDRVHFVGWAEPAAVAEYLRAADVFVGPSKRSPDGWVEAQGLVFVEAMLAEIPVVATATGGVVDLVRDGETGILVEESSPDQIASAVQKLCQSEELRNRLKEGGRRLVEGQYTRTASAARFSALYSSLLGCGRAG